MEEFGLTVSQALLELKALLSNPKRWVKGAYAKDDRGEHTNSRDPHAVCFCITGGINRTCGANTDLRAIVKKKLIANLPRGFEALERFNDDSEITHAQILELIEKTHQRVVEDEPEPLV